MQASVSNQKPVIQEKKKVLPGIYRWLGDYCVDNKAGSIRNGRRDKSEMKEQDYLVVIFLYVNTALVVQSGLTQHKNGDLVSLIAFSDKDWELCPSDYLVTLSN